MKQVLMQGMGGYSLLPWALPSQAPEVSVAWTPALGKARVILVASL